MLERAHAAARDHRNRHRACHGAGERQVKARLGTVAVHAGQQDLSGAAASRLLGPRHRVDTRGVAASRGKNLPLVGSRLAGQPDALGIDCHNHGLAAKRRGSLANQRRIAHGGGVERHLVGAGRHHGPHTRQVAKATAHGVGNGQLLGRMRRHLDGRRTVVTRGRDVQEHDLVRALAVVGAGKLHRIARIAQAHKVDALDHAAVLDVQAGNDAFGKHGYSSPRAAASAWASVKLPS